MIRPEDRVYQCKGCKMRVTGVFFLVKPNGGCPRCGSVFMDTELSRYDVYEERFREVMKND